MPLSRSPDDWAALANRFGLGRIIGRPVYITRGAMGEIWRLRTAGGQWAAKWQFPWAPTDPRPADVAVQLAAASAGIPLPLPVTTPDGTAVASVGGGHARVYEWADLGTPFEPPVSAARAAEAGRLLGVLHALALTQDVPADPWYTDVSGTREWAAPRLSAAHDLIADVAALAVPTGSQPSVVCHRDFSPDNVLPDPGGRQLLVLDWENSGPLDPHRELGAALFAWCAGSGRFDLAAGRAMLAGYAGVTGALPRLTAGSFATAAAVQLNYLKVMGELALSEPDHREYAEREIASLLTRDLRDLRQFAMIAPANLTRPAAAGGSARSSCRRG
jgi:Ser/Thr protein kinase RdoA (MazF antagonist)